MESTTLNTYTAPMYIVELLTKILNAITEITGGDGSQQESDLNDIKNTLNLINDGTTSISENIVNGNNVSNTIAENTLQTVNAVNTHGGNIVTNTNNTANNTATIATNSNAITANVATLVEYTLAANNKLNFMNPTHLGVVAEGDTSFEQPVVLCNITDSNVTVTVTANQDTNPVSIVLTPGWNPVVVKAITGATANQLVYGY